MDNIEEQKVAYFQAIEKIKKEAEELNLDDYENESRKDFLISKSTRNIFLGKQSEEEHLSFFKKCFFYRQLTYWDTQSDIRVLYDMIKLEGDLSCLEDDQSGPFIFCTFHYGAYQSILPILNIKGIEFSVITQYEYEVNDVVKYGDKRYADKVRQRKTNTFNPKSWSILLDLIKGLKDKKSILAFLDRTESAGAGKNKKEKLEWIDFLNFGLNSRTGIPEIAYRRRAPIIPIMSYRNETNDDISIRLFPPITVQASEKKEAFVKRSLKELFGILEDYVKRCPEQWEYWYEIYKNMDLTSINPYQTETPSASLRSLLFGKRKEDKEKRIKLPFEIPEATIAEDQDLLTFNMDRYGVFLEEEQYYLLDFITMVCFKISENLKNILDALKTDTIKKARLKSYVHASLVEDLENKMVLIISSKDKEAINS